MNVEMLPVEIVGLKQDLNQVMSVLRAMGSVHIDEVNASPHASARPLALDRNTLNRQEELSFLLARTQGLLDILGCGETGESSLLPANDLPEVRECLDRLGPQVRSLTERREELQSKLALLPRYEATLRKLLPIIPPSARDPRNVSIGMLVSRVNVGVLDSIASRILDLSGGRAEVVSSDVDATTRAMFTVLPKEYTAQVEALLGREDVARLRLPDELSGGPPDAALQALQRQMAAIPVEISQLNRDLAGIAV
jgi:vacuolar-type H+-ATPase subunit I/STV1